MLAGPDGKLPQGQLVRFCHNHGLLQITDRPQWYTVVGGAREYVKKMASTITEVRLGDPVESIRRAPDASGTITVKGRHESATYEHVVLACHTDQALRLLDDPSAEERSILGAIGYQPNRAVLHTDISVLPRRKRAWAAWNYQCRLGADASNEQGVCVHYLINRLQPLPFKSPVIVSLNPFPGIAQNTIQGEYDYSHPVFDAAALEAQRRLDAVQGRQNTWYAGAWTGYGFHEDGLRSGLAAADAILACATPTVALAA